MKQERTVGVIGLGAMGYGIAHNLIKKGFQTSVLGRQNRKPVEDLVSQGAVEGKNPKELAATCDHVIICVIDSKQVETIVFGEDGLLAGARAGSMIIDCSTSDPASTARIFDEFAKRDVGFVDAPLGRTSKEALEGRLNVMVGASPDLLDRIRPLLETFAENIFHVGGSGSGHAAKLANNFISMGHLALLAEAFAGAKKANVDIKVLGEILSKGPVNSTMLNTALSAAQSGAFDAINFKLNTARKDLRYYSRLMEEMTVPSPIADACFASFTRAASVGLGDEGVLSLIKAQDLIGKR